jgi:uncharacterized damage-inducible protein DinB
MSNGQKEQPATIGQMLAAELKQEAISTRKMLERIPSEQFQYKPHERSMPLVSLAGHIADMIGWTNVTINEDELDFAKSDFTPKEYNDASELTAYFDRNISSALEILSSVSNETLMQPWRLRNGEQIYFEMPKAVVMRSMVMNHIIHHRGQLAVYLRMLDVPVPSIYGPSADEQIF